MKKYPRNSKDEVNRTPAGPMISLYDTRYFVPQWDEQMLGPTWRHKRGKWDFDNPPKPLQLTDPKMKDAFKYCEQCQLTWLVGYDKLEGHQHPQHLAWAMKEEHIDYHRWGIDMEASLVVYIHGDCLPKGQAPKSPVGNTDGYGIFFGNGSKYNASHPHMKKSAAYDAEDAELAAIDLALTIVRYDIVKDRKEHLRASAKSKRADGSKTGANLAKLDMEHASASRESNTTATPSKPTEAAENADDTRASAGEKGSDDESRDVLDKLPFRVIFVSDNAKVVDSICKYHKQWKEEDGKLLTKQGKPVQNGDVYQELEEAICEMEENFDTTLKWYCVPKRFNEGAAKLAKDALEGNLAMMKARKSCTMLDKLEPI
ncbi:hypothetical protein F5Y06DRAFT_220927 [Hypoxylon sp. FL0890]|nr:hypothetical protein F5Y06DRAFT_220927 [Hypoxylon sp. FL0890]